MIRLEAVLASLHTNLVSHASFGWHASTGRLACQPLCQEDANLKAQQNTG